MNDAEIDAIRPLGSFVSGSGSRFMELKLAAQAHGDCTVLEVDGEIDVHTVPRLREQFNVLFASGRARYLVVDLEKVQFIDSTGLGVLVHALKRARAKEGQLRLVCTGEGLLRTFRIAGLSRTFSIYLSVSDALDGINQIPLTDPGEQPR